LSYIAQVSWDKDIFITYYICDWCTCHHSMNILKVCLLDKTIKCSREIKLNLYMPLDHLLYEWLINDVNLGEDTILKYETTNQDINSIWIF